MEIAHNKSVKSVHPFAHNAMPFFYTLALLAQVTPPLVSPYPAIVFLLYSYNNTIKSRV